jgi:hypothetical protein
VPAKPTVQDIVDAWHPAPPANAWWAPTFDYKSPTTSSSRSTRKYGKPVLFTEAGYLSVDYGGLISGATGIAGPINVQEQADAYQAFFQVWGPSAGDWLQGDTLADLRDAMIDAVQSVDNIVFTNRAADSFALPNPPLAPPMLHDIIR